MKKNILFIHSLFRSGSTYIFHAFRRSENNNYCYQEPLNEFVWNAREQPDTLMDLKGAGEMQRLLKHPDIGRPYFAELYDTFEHWKSVITPEISYDDYFGSYAPKKTNVYLEALIKAPAKKNIVIQECRTGARIGNIKKDLGGYHVSIWRNPWDQWWSSKSTEYFEIIPQVIASAPKIPTFIKMICDASDIAILPHHSFEQKMRHFEQRWVKPGGSYMLFFGLWCLNILEARKQADMLLSIDALSKDTSYRETIIETFSKVGFPKLNFLDCNIPQSIFTASDAEFFRPIEETVYEFLLKTEVDADDVRALRKLCNESTPVLKDLGALSEAEQKYLRTVSSLRSMVLTGQEGREREGSNSNTSISMLNTQLIDLQKDKPQNAEFNETVKLLNTRLEQLDVERRNQISEYQKLLGEQNETVKHLNKRLKRVDVERRRQISTYQKLLDEKIDSVKSLMQIIQTLSKQNDSHFSNLNRAELQLENEREHHEFLQLEHESLLSFIQDYEQKSQGAIEEYIRISDELTTSIENLTSQKRQIQVAKEFREAELLTEISKHEMALENVRRSTSWRITQPMRSLFNLRRPIKSFVRTKLFALLAFMRSIPLLKAIAKKIIALLPGLRSKAEAFSLANPKPLLDVKSTGWNLQLDKNATKLWMSALKKEEKT